MSRADALRARADSYRRAEAIALGLVQWCHGHGVKPTSMEARAREARRQARAAERELARMETKR